MELECLLIDDDVDDQEIFLMALKQVDAQIRCSIANDGMEGLYKLSEDFNFFPSFIFIDINMHKMNGIECLKEIKKLGYLINSKVIMLSTSTDDKILKQSKELGADLFLAKPPEFSALVTQLSNIFNGQLL